MKWIGAVWWTFADIKRYFRCENVGQSQHGHVENVYVCVACSSALVIHFIDVYDRASGGIVKISCNATFSFGNDFPMARTRKRFKNDNNII